jgi:hypothetical protein
LRVQPKAKLASALLDGSGKPIGERGGDQTGGGRRARPLRRVLSP